MYSEQLESLIQSIIADGIITDKERAVLHKKAEAEGVDVDEIDVYVEGLVAQLSKGGKAKMARQYDKSKLISETAKYSSYYKLQKSYILAKDMSFRFVDIIDFSLYRIESPGYKENDEYYKSFCLFISLNARLSEPNFRFRTSEKELFACAWNSHLDNPWDKRCIQLQTIGHNDAKQTVGFMLNEDQLKLLCDTSDIMIESPNNTNFILRELPGFQYYAQYFYRATLDPEAYPDAEMKIEESITKPKLKKTGGLTEQQLAGMLSRKVKGKRTTPTPYYLSQYLIQNATITEVRGRIITRQGEQEGPHIYLHAISTNENDNIFYLCITARYWNEISKDRVVLSINLQDYELEPVTTQSSFLSEKNIHKEEEKYNFFFISNNILEKLLKSRGTILKFIRSREHVTEYKFLSIPKKWGKAFEILKQEDGLKKWANEKGTISKFIETYLHLSLGRLICYILLILFIFTLIFSS